MANVLIVCHYKDGKSSPMANGPQTQTALEADGESAAYPESEGLPKNSKESGMELAPMGNLCALVNENLRDCPEKSCKGTQLKLEVDRRIGFASSWKLTCSSCEKLETTANNRLNLLLNRRTHSCSSGKRCFTQKFIPHSPQPTGRRSGLDSTKASLAGS